MRPSVTATAVLSLALHALVGGVAVRGLGARGAPAEAALALDPPAALAGETFDVDEEGNPALNDIELPDTPVPVAVEPPASTGGDEAPAPPRKHSRSAPPRKSRPAASEPPGGGGSGGLYGAAGERTAADLATAFTRGFSQAASSDPVWVTAPLGSAGTADLVIHLDETGHVTAYSLSPGAASPLARGVSRTMALLGARPFTARGAVTRLHLVAQVAADAVHDGLHGDVFAIGGSFNSGEGSAFFALAIGRRIDLRVTLR